MSNTVVFNLPPVVSNTSAAAWTCQCKEGSHAWSFAGSRTLPGPGDLEM
jgi:hypothetical protein